MSDLDTFDPRPSFDVSGRSILITGGGRGLGRAMSLGLAACGARVTVVGRSKDELDATVQQVRDAGGEAVAVSADITTDDGRRAAVAGAVEAFGGLDVLVNNAGMPGRATLDDLSLERWEEVHALNTSAPLFLAQAALPHLVESDHASIINVLSITLWTSGPGSTLYRSSKAALQASTMVLAQELADRDIRVNALIPGTFEEGMGGRLAPERLAGQNALTPMKRPGRPGELVPAVLFLASDASSYVTGATLRVDGGRVSL